MQPHETAYAAAFKGTGDSGLKPTLSAADFPHLNQSAFHKHNGCADAIFSTNRKSLPGTSVRGRLCIKMICASLTLRRLSTALNSQCCFMSSFKWVLMGRRGDSSGTGTRTESVLYTLMDHSL